MADIITVSSSEDEEVIASPPRKRIRPTPVLANLPNVTITKIPKKKEKKQDIVVLCSDDDEGDIRDEKEVEEVVTCIDDEKKGVEKQLLKSNGNNKDSVIQLSGEVPPANTNNVYNESIEINDVDDDHIDHAELIKDLENSCEIINEDSEQESSGKENRSVDRGILDDVQPCSSITYAKSPNAILLGKYVKIVDDKVQEDKYSIIKEQFPKLWSNYKKCEDDLGDSASLKNMLTSNIERAEKSTEQAVISFNEVFSHFKEIVHADSVLVEKEDLKSLKRLEKTIKNCLSMIKQLENTDIDFDQEEDSSYLKLEKYITRLDQVYKKYCKLTKRNPNYGRLTYAKLDFVDSEFNEINRAISKTYKDNKKFPSYFEMEQFIRKVAKDRKLKLSDSKIKSESVHCFKKLGELLQNRRRKELYDGHHMLIKDSEDPAKEDSELSTTLKNNYAEGQLKIEKLVAEYVDKAENKNEEQSEDSESESDTSDCVDSEDGEENSGVGEENNENGG